MALQGKMQNDPVSKLSLRSPHIAITGTTIRNAVVEMRQKNLGCTILVDDQRVPNGMFTESMLIQLLALTPRALDRTIEDQAAQQWPWVRLTDPVTHVLDAMQLKNVRLLCVVDEDGRLAGVTGQRGLMAYVANHLSLGIEVRRVGGTSPAVQTEKKAVTDAQERTDSETPRDSLETALTEETMAAIQHEPYVVITPDTPIQEATQKLAGLHVACLLVADDRRLVGVFSERDVLNKVVLEYDKLKDQPTSEVMTSNPIYVHETDSPAAALSVMSVSGYRHVPVLNNDDNLIGIVSPQRITAFLQRYFEE